MVPTSSIIMMAVNAILGIAVPVCLAWYLVRKHQAKLSTILIGAGTFIVFALVLESIMHQIVLKGPYGPSITGNTLLFALYGGLAAGIFEETGRFLAMKFLMKKEPTTPLPGIAYGAGHGGAEMLIIFGFTMISSLVMAIMINTGQTDSLFAQAPEDAAALLQTQLDSLQNSTAGSYLIGLWERISALILQLSLSILVWAAVRKGGKWLWLFPAAILLHALVDGLAVLLQNSVGMVALELIVFAEAIVTAAIAYAVAKKI
ncbi:MAG: YhfC family intramembrane metalloprotease [Bacteroidales bacterium]|nr:YhfC family intramembrane metalloprotease [Bacteroidales bacterium]MBR5671559.1 YhfC family intramembrane metalloprotease [Bacteroidales bacterium]